MTQKEIMLYDQMVENDIATAEEINLVRNIVDGSWEEILNEICYARTGYRDLDQYFEAEMEEQREQPSIFWSGRGWAPGLAAARNFIISHASSFVKRKNAQRSGYFSPKIRHPAEINFVTLHKNFLIFCVIFFQVPIDIIKLLCYTIITVRETSQAKKGRKKNDVL